MREKTPMLYAELIRRINTVLAVAFVADGMTISDSVLRQCLLFFSAWPFALAHLRTLTATPDGTLLATWGDGQEQEFPGEIALGPGDSLVTVQIPSYLLKYREPEPSPLDTSPPVA